MGTNTTRERVRNAFESVRPKGADAPPAPPRPRIPGRAPATLPGSMVRDRTGKLCVPLEPRPRPGFAIEPRAQAHASVLKRQAMAMRGI
jgi:hypothetical protein